jgi:hypothetical protein
METWIWILIAVVVAVVVIAAVIAGMKKKQEHDRQAAADLRDTAGRQKVAVERRDAEARTVEAEAERVRAEADRLEAIAQERRNDVEAQRASYTDRLQKADELDPDVKHRAD